MITLSGAKFYRSFNFSAQLFLLLIRSASPTEPVRTQRWTHEDKHDENAVVLHWTEEIFLSPKSSTYNVDREPRDHQLRIRIPVLQGDFR